MKVKITQTHLTLSDPMVYTAHGILQTRILEWVAFLFSRGDPNPGIKPRSPALQTDSLLSEPPGKPLTICTQFSIIKKHKGDSLVAQLANNLPAIKDTWVQSLGREDPMEMEIATRSNILAWRIPWTEDPDGLQSMGSQRTGHN